MWTSLSQLSRKSAKSMMRDRASKKSNDGELGSQEPKPVAANPFKIRSIQESENKSFLFIFQIFFCLLLVFDHKVAIDFIYLLNNHISLQNSNGQLNTLISGTTYSLHGQGV